MAGISPRRYRVLTGQFILIRDPNLEFVCPEYANRDQVQGVEVSGRTVNEP